MRSYLREYIKAAPKIGRGFLIDTSQLDQEALIDLQVEYTDVARESTAWARHADIAKDELEVIHEFAHAPDLAFGPDQKDYRLKA